MGPNRCYSVPVDAAALSHYATTLGSSGRERPLRTLARAVASSPVWKERSVAILMTRPHQRPALILLSQQGKGWESYLAVTASELNQTCRRLRYIDYHHAEQDCRSLASRLVERLGEADLSRFRFTSIPRGGHIVLGMLAYMLDLKRAQLQAPHPSDLPLVVVDDCSLTGARFHQFIDRCENQRIVFCPLYSHPNLRAAIESRETRVLACLSAQDLSDYGPSELEDAYPAWQERWCGRLKGYRYWVGQVGYICFPWNEPDRLLWNPVTQQVETGWRVVPPELCLKNESHPGWSKARVCLQAEAVGPLAPPPHVFFCDYQGQTVVGNLETSEAIGLDGVGADIWKAIIRTGDREAALQVLLSEYEVDPTTVEEDLATFLDALLARELLQERATPGLG